MTRLLRLIGKRKAALLLDGKRFLRPHEQLEFFIPSGIASFLPGLLSCFVRVQRRKEGMAHHLERLLMDGKAPFSQALPILPSRAFSPVPPWIAASHPDVCRFPWSGPNSLGRSFE
jgi:hypothetical protein